MGMGGSPIFGMGGAGLYVAGAFLLLVVLLVVVALLATRRPH